MHIATHTDVMDNPHYGVGKLNLAPPFFRCYKEP